MSPNLIAYKTGWCAACATLIPEAQDIASEKGWGFEQVDVDQCKTEKCESVSYVPHFELDGREVSLEEMREL